MQQWRVTKFDPRHRDRRGRFLAGDWTAVSDIGSEYGGTVLTLEAYLAVETAYVDAAMHFVREVGLETLTIIGLEADDGVSLDDDPARGIDLDLDPGFTPREGQHVSGAAIEQLIRLNLRSLLWCKLEEPERMFLHFGHDYYMYVGSRSPTPRSVDYARQLGLFVEPMTSPYYR